MNMEINPSEYKILIVDDVMSNVLLLKVLCKRLSKYIFYSSFSLLTFATKK